MNQLLPGNMDCKAVFLLLLLLLFANTTSKAVRQNMSRHARRKAIKNTQGDVYDCVHKYKQPAFNSVDFKKHKIQAKPSEEVYKRMGLNPLDGKQLDPHHFGFEEWCASSYVPIQRIAYNNSPSDPKNANHSLSQSSIWYAGVRTKFSDTKEYHGADAYIALYQPILYKDHEYSSSLISIIGGQSEDTKIIAGWTVNQDLNPDDKTRVVIGWTNDNFQSIGCYNLLCSGFVLTGNANPIGSVITPISAGDAAVDMRFTVAEDSVDWKWWLFINSSPVGYWPHWLFTASLQNGANMIFWGGIAYSPPDQYASPQMGSGGMKIGGRTCYMRNVLFSNSQSQWQSPDVSFLDVLSSPYYFVERDPSRNNGGYFFYFGGKGRRW